MKTQEQWTDEQLAKQRMLSNLDELESVFTEDKNIVSYKKARKNLLDSIEAYINIYRDNTWAILKK